MKPFYTKKGKYADGRTKIIIVIDNGNKSITLPKPEALVNILQDRDTLSKIPKEKQGENRTP